MSTNDNRCGVLDYHLGACYVWLGRCSTAIGYGSKEMDGRFVDRPIGFVAESPSDCGCLCTYCWKGGDLMTLPNLAADRGKIDRSGTFRNANLHLSQSIVILHFSSHCMYVARIVSEVVSRRLSDNADMNGSVRLISLTIGSRSRGIWNVLLLRSG